MKRFIFLHVGLRALQAVAASVMALTVLTVLAACAAGTAPGSSGTSGVTGSGASSSSGGATTAGYTGPAAKTADIQAFQTKLWANISGSDKCGGCHFAGGQSPQFARTDDVNLAYQAVMSGSLVNLQSPAQSTLVTKVAGGHNCFLATPQDCATQLTAWIQAWASAGSAIATAMVAGVTLTTPVDQAVGTGKAFPGDSNQFQALIWTPYLRKFCVDCHRPDAATAQTPYFASADPDQAYIAAQSKINLNTPAESRFVVRLRDEFHHCWATTGTTPDCPGSAAAMLTAITNYANGITAKTVDPTLVLSKTLKLRQGASAAGVGRYETNLIAKYEFKEGTGNTAADTSGVTPAADLSLSGAISWPTGWGLTFGSGGTAQASVSASQKLAQMIGTTGEYSIETWITPANITQTDAYVVTYSSSNTTRNMTLGQHAMQYEARTRSNKSDNNGAPALLTSASGMFAQAVLQHVVLTYDAVNGQKIYVNGKYTGDADSSKGGKIANWDTNSVLALGNETTGQRQWQGTIRFVAVFKQALTADQVQQNFTAGVGERYYLLFNVSALTAMPQTFIMMEASQYDSYSYLFRKPRFISLDPNAAPNNLSIAGIRIGLNGTVASVGQSYATVNTTVGSSTYTAANGQLLSSVGAVIASDKGIDNDYFFLSFDKLGSMSHTFVEPGAANTTTGTTMTASTARPDLGIATFERVNRTMSSITGVPVTNTTVSTLYNSVQQSLPPAPGVDAFLPAHQAAITQLATAYCGQLVDTQSLRDAFFGTGLDSNINATSSTFFGGGTNTVSTTQTANRNLVIDPLLNNAVGNGVYATATGAARTELNNLFTRIPTLSSTATVSQATKAACTAVLASSLVMLQ